ncbi:MAG: hypothetical protein PHP07_07920 [Eubacteriales bacterium]|jgi:hypothetical protein|nr:hypothetical protein [Eubacteriales bacterium]MDD4135163.1 hypothetical protein [Eubacteriales bacterium]
MEWWAWALIAVGFLALGYVKLKLFNRMVRKKKTPSFKDED